MPERTLKPIFVACLLALSAAAQDEPKPRIIIEPPLAAPLSSGAAVIRYRTEHLQVVPVFGPAALAVSPRLGHVHVSVDDARWVWANTSGQPVILQGLPPGRHKVLMQLMSPTHQPLDEAAIEFTVPDGAKARAVATSGPVPAGAGHTEPAAKIIVGSPLPEPLSRGVIIIPYRAEHVQLVPVFGPEALDVSPRLGHVHVTIDETSWHWADGSGNQIIVAGLSPGPHNILIELSNANHEVLDRGTVRVTVPGRRTD